jgi:hypothetical protein
MQLQNIMGETDQRPPALDFSQGYRRVELPLFEQDSGQPVFLCAPQTRYGLATLALRRRAIEMLGDFDASCVAVYKTRSG